VTLLGFKARFAGDVERRIKRQSIRESDRFRVGMYLQLYTGLRTKACRKLVEDDPVCTSVQAITIAAGQVVLGGQVLRGDAVEELARLDGFSSVEEFKAFFITDGKPFAGFLIKWDWPDETGSPRPD
jgi:hypothetical protein